MAESQFLNFRFDFPSPSCNLLVVHHHHTQIDHNTLSQESRPVRSTILPMKQTNTSSLHCRDYLASACPARSTAVTVLLTCAGLAFLKCNSSSHVPSTFSSPAPVKLSEDLRVGWALCFHLSFAVAPQLLD